MKKKCETNLDEMQEQKLLMIEHNMAWIAFWGLLAAMVVQSLIFRPADIRSLAGEWIVFMTLCIYLVAGCLKNGIWDRKLKPDPKTNFLVSLTGAAIVGGVYGIIVFRNTGSWKTALITFGVAGVIMLAICYLLLVLTVKLYKKRVAELEDTAEGES